MIEYMINVLFSFYIILITARIKTCTRTINSILYFINVELSKLKLRDVNTIIIKESFFTIPWNKLYLSEKTQELGLFVKIFVVRDKCLLESMIKKGV